MMTSVAVLLFLLANSFAVSLAKQECTSSGDCPQERVCAANLCEDPCDGFCGENTVCQVKWHTPICRCLQGYNGDPMQGCTNTAGHECFYNSDCPQDKVCQSRKCKDPCSNICGENTVCQVKGHIPVCSCRQGYFGDPIQGCTERAPECNINDDCDQDRACYGHRCKDPCHNACGSNATCRVSKHIPVCRCNEGFTGDPVEGCTVPDCKPQNTTETAGKKKFEISTFKLNWYGAFVNCQSRGMRLATIEDKEQDDDFITLFKTSVSYLDHASITWIGATDLVKEGDWYWMTTGQSISKYKHWIGIEPNNYARVENCMGYWKNNNAIGWCDYICSKECFFACEYY